MSQLNFNAEQVTPQKPFEPVPNGWYNVVIDESETKPTNDPSNDSAYLALRLNILDGDYANQKLFPRLNLWNENPKTVEIAEQQLSAICHATNTIQVGQSSELHGKPFMVKVIVKPPSGGYDASNEFKGFKACDGSTGGGQATPGAGGDPSWTKNNQQQAQEEKKPDTIQQSWNQNNQQEKKPEEQKPTNTQQTWQQNNQQNNQQATVEKTPNKDNGGGVTKSNTAPWMQKK